jgi:uncharacterized protein YjiS (DUF1127 family)
MWASNDQEARWENAGWNFKINPADQAAIHAAARRMQAEELAKLFRAVGRGLKAVFGVVAAPYKVWREYQETYHELSQLDDRMLSDIGITRSDIPRVAAGLWAPQERMERIVKLGLTPKAGANVNRPQVAA